jgi:hypothetical protein
MSTVISSSSSLSSSITASIPSFSPSTYCLLILIDDLAAVSSTLYWLESNASGLFIDWFIELRLVVSIIDDPSNTLIYPGCRMPDWCSFLSTIETDMFPLLLLLLSIELRIDIRLSFKSLVALFYWALNTAWLLASLSGRAPISYALRYLTSLSMLAEGITVSTSLIKKA